MSLGGMSFRRLVTSLSPSFDLFVIALLPYILSSFSLFYLFDIRLVTQRICMVYILHNGSIPDKATDASDAFN